MYDNLFGVRMRCEMLVCEVLRAKLMLTTRSVHGAFQMLKETRMQQRLADSPSNRFIRKPSKGRAVVVTPWVESLAAKYEVRPFMLTHRDTWMLCPSCYLPDCLSVRYRTLIAHQEGWER